MNTVEIKGVTYAIGTINAFTQLHVIRRMAPVLEQLKGLADAFDKDNPDAVLGPLGRAVASLPDADVDYILGACLDAVSVRQQGGGFAPARVRGAVMFPLDLVTLLALTAHVIRENLGTFFSDLPILATARTGTGSNG